MGDGRSSSVASDAKRRRSAPPLERRALQNTHKSAPLSVDCQKFNRPASELINSQRIGERKRNGKHSRCIKKTRRERACGKRRRRRVRRSTSPPRQHSRPQNTQKMCARAAARTTSSRAGGRAALHCPAGIGLLKTFLCLRACVSLCLPPFFLHRSLLSSSSSVDQARRPPQKHHIQSARRQKPASLIQDLLL